MKEVYWREGGFKIKIPKGRLCEFPIFEPKNNDHFGGWRKFWHFWKFNERELVPLETQNSAQRDKIKS